jgi:predicted GTPase
MNTAIRYLTSEIGMSQPFRRLQENFIAWFVTAYIHRVGTYLIDLNSGRLKVGARRFRELRSAWGLDPATTEPKSGTGDVVDTGADIARVGLAVIGQVKAGKSSVINALLGEQKAETDVLPLTAGVTRYALPSDDKTVRLEIFDTVGYGREGPRQDQLRLTQELVQQSDLVLLVCHARNPGRQADLLMLQSLRTWSENHPTLRRPQILAVLSHIDLLTPAMEWAPPYNFVAPERPKEHSIRAAQAALGEQLGEYLAGIVPVCAAAGKEYGIKDHLLPALVRLLDEARGVAFLRCLHAEANAGKIRKIWQQLLEVGKVAAREVWVRSQK